MDALQKLEHKLDGFFNKKVPFKLPQAARKSLADALWILALVFGILQLWTAWDMWHIGHYVDSVLSGYALPGPDLGFTYYLSVIVLVISAVVVLVAAPALKEHKKAGGWDLLFLGLLLNAVHGLIRIFSNVNGGFGEMLWALLVSAVGAYFLFQVRDNFMVSKTTSHHADTHKGSTGSD